MDTGRNFLQTIIDHNGEGKRKYPYQPAEQRNPSQFFADGSILAALNQETHSGSMAFATEDVDVKRETINKKCFLAILK